MKNAQYNQKKLAFILFTIVFSVFMIMLALMNISIFLAVLIVFVIGICLLRMKKPGFFSDFSGKEPIGSSDAVPSRGRAVDGFRSHFILLYHDGVQLWQIPVNKPEFSIGRKETCDLVLRGNNNISKIHAIIKLDAGSGFSMLLDNGSTNGTKLNAERLIALKPYELHSGDMIQIEDRILTVQSKNF